MIESSPGQSQVYIDDEPVGSTSQQGRLKLTRLAAGDHRVRISLSGLPGSRRNRHARRRTSHHRRRHAPAARGASGGLTPPQPPQPEETPTVNPGQAGYLGVRPMKQQPAGARGVVISGALPGGPADQAGLKAYDTILAVNGQPVTTPQDIRAALAGHQAGEVVQITWYNGSRQRHAANPAGRCPAPARAQAPAQPVAPPTLSNMPHNGFVTFPVAHDHGQSGQDYCVGVMSIGNGMISYKADNGVHTFEIPLNSIRAGSPKRRVSGRVRGVSYPHQERHEFQLRGRQPTKPAPAP